MRAAVSVLVVLVALAPPLRAIDIDITPVIVQQALDLAQRTKPAERAAYHRTYVVPVVSPPLRKISVVTEFRRVVLAAEERLRVGDRLFGVREATEAVAPWRGRVQIIAELQYHPQNNFISVPPIDVFAWPQDERRVKAPLLPLSTDRVPAYGYSFDTSLPEDWQTWWPFPPVMIPGPPGSQPLTGAWIQATFDAREIGPRTRIEMLVKDGLKTIGSATFDLGAVR
jgi:hypothetical protein